MLSDFDSRVIIRIFIKQKWIVLQALAVAIMVAGYMSMKKATSYMVSANIQLASDQSGKMNLGIEGFGASNSNSQVEKEKYFLTSRVFLEKVVKKLHPMMKHDEIKGEIYRISRMLNVESVQEAGILKIFVYSSSKDGITELINTIADEYVNEKNRQATEGTENKLQLVTELLKEREKLLHESEETIRKYQESTRVFDMEGKAEKLLGKIEGFEEQILELNLKTKISGIQKDEFSRRSDTADQVVESPPKFVINPIIPELKREQRILETEKVLKMNSGYTEKHPDIIVIDMKKEVLSKMLKEEEKEKFVKVESGMIENPLIPKLREEIFNIEVDNYVDSAKKKAAEELLAQYNEKIQDLPAETLKFKRMRNELERNESLYQSLMMEYERIKIEKSSFKSNVQVLDYAEEISGGEQYVFPAVILFPVSLVIGIVFGISVAFMREMSYGLFKTPTDVSNILGIPCETALPMVKNATKRELYLPECIHAGYAEWIKQLALLIVKRCSTEKVILTTSAEFKEGKTITTLNLALALSEAGKRVCVIDADMRSPEMHKVLKINGDGLAQIIAGKKSLEESVIRISERFHVIPSGAVINDALGMFSENQTHVFFEKLKNMYDFVLVDTIALNVADTFALTQYVDFTLFIVNLNKSLISATKDAFFRLQKYTGNIMVIMNEYW